MKKLMILTILFSILCGSAFSAEPKPRVIVTTDGEIDDFCSFTRFLLYTCDFDVEGLIYSSSIFHWNGHNWAGTNWMQEKINLYGQSYSNLSANKSGYPTATTLQSKVYVGNINSAGDMSADTPGSNRIVQVLRDSDPRPVWILMWGGTNTAARALYHIQQYYPGEMAAVSQKAKLIIGLDQDNTLEDYVRPNWPNLTVICDYGIWMAIGYEPHNYVSDSSKLTYYSNSWMLSNITSNHGPLLSARPNASTGTFVGEGDTITFLNLMPVGFFNQSNPGYGCWGGRYAKQPNSNTYWEDDWDDEEYCKCVWRWIDAYQNDYAARADWCVNSYANCNHPPVVNDYETINASPSQNVNLTVSASDPDGDNLSYQWWYYKEAGSYHGSTISINNAASSSASFTVPSDSGSGQSIHMICSVTDNGTPPLTRYRRVIVNVTSGTPSIPGPGPFVKGINFGGNAVTIEGNLWLSEAQARASGLSVSSGCINPSRSEVPYPDPGGDTRAMLMSSITPWADVDMSLSQTISNGNYNLFFWMFEWGDFYWGFNRNFTIYLEGQPKVYSAGVLNWNRWHKYGPIPVTVSDGTLNILCDQVKRWPHLMGMSIHSASTPSTSVTVSATDASASETGPDTGTFTVTRSGSTSGDLTVNYSVSGTAASGSDYTALSGSVVIPNGQSSATITVTPIDDSAIEDSETVILTLTGTANYTVGTPGSATVTITDNDTSSTTVTISATDASASETGPDNGAFTVSRTGTSGDITVNYTVSGTATAGYSGSGDEITVSTVSSTASMHDGPSATIDGSLSSRWLSVHNQGEADPWISWEWSSEKNLAEMDVANYAEQYQDRRGMKYVDIYVKQNGSWVLWADDYKLQPQTGNSNTGIWTDTIDFNDVSCTGVKFDPKNNYYTSSPEISGWGTNYWADGRTEYPAANGDSAALTGLMEVAFYETSITGGDYQALSGSVTIANGQSSATITVIPYDDTNVEGDETVIVTLASGTGYTVGTPSSATVTISDNDSATPTVTIAATDASASESGPDTGTFTVTRSGSTSGDMTVNYTVSGSATSGSDYSALSGSVVISDGQASATITVTPIDDSEVEGSETVVVTLASGTGYAIDSPSSATVTIADNDTATMSVTISATDSSAAEQGSDTGTFTVTRSGGTTGDLTVYYTVSGTATPSSSGSGGEITVSTVSSTASMDQDGPSATIDDSLSTRWLSVHNQGEADPWISWEWSTEKNLAEMDVANYAESSQDRRGMKYVDIYIKQGGVWILWADDYKLDPQTGNSNTGIWTDTINFTGISCTGVKFDPKNNYYTASPEISGWGTNCWFEGRTEYPAANNDHNALTGLMEAAFYETSSTGGDYQALSGSVTIADGQSSATITVIPYDDTVAESDETVIVTLAEGAGYTVGSPDSATVTISDNDSSTTTVTVTATDASASETGPDTGTFTITRSGTSTNEPLTVNYSFSGTAVQGTDYTNGDGSVVIQSGQTSAAITITPVDDSIVESDETVILTLSSGTGYTVGSPDSATVTISDNDTGAMTVTISATDASASEAGPDTGTFTVTRSGGTSGDLTVYYTVSGTATASSSGSGGEITVSTVSSTASMDSAGPAATVDGSLSTRWLSVHTGVEADPWIAWEWSSVKSLAEMYVANYAEQYQDRRGMKYVDIYVKQGGSWVLWADDYKLDPQTGNSNTGGWTDTIDFNNVNCTGVKFDPKNNYYTSSPEISGWGTNYWLEGRTQYPAAVDDTVALTGLMEVAFYETSGSSGDYEALLGSVTIADGQSSATITVTPIDDSIVESDETVILTLTSGTGYTVGTPGSATVTISDNDQSSGITVTISATDAEASETGPDTGTFTVSRTGGTSGDLTVYYTVSGTASTAIVNQVEVSSTSSTASMDQDGPSATIDGSLSTRWMSVHNQGEADPWISWEFGSAITLAEMDVANYAEQYQDRRGMKYVDIYVKQSGNWVLWADDYKLNPQTGNTSPGVWTDTIDFNDVLCTGVKFDPKNNYYTSSPEISGWGTNYWAESRTEYPAANGDDAALTGLMEVTFYAPDYHELTGSVVIPDGQSSATITVTPNDDDVAESSETVVVTLYNDSAYSIGSPSSATVTIADND